MDAIHHRCSVVGVLVALVVVVIVPGARPETGAGLFEKQVAKASHRNAVAAACERKRELRVLRERIEHAIAAIDAATTGSERDIARAVLTRLVQQREEQEAAVRQAEIAVLRLRRTSHSCSMVSSPFGPCGRPDPCGE